MEEEKFTEFIENLWINGDEDERFVENTFEKLNGQMEELYHFVLSYYDYLYIPRDYGNGEEWTMLEIHVLTDIADNPGITVTKLSEKWHRTTSMISQLVRNYSNLNLIKRERNKDNGKINNLYILPEGEKLVRVHKIYDNIDTAKTMKVLAKETSFQDIEAFFRVIKKYKDIISRVEKNTYNL